MFPRARRKFSGRRVQQGSLTGLICRSGMSRWREGGKAGAERRHDYANITRGDCTFVEWRGQAERRQSNVLGGVLEFTCVASMHRSTSSKHTFAVSPPYCRRISSPFIVFSDGANTCRPRTDDGGPMSVFKYSIGMAFCMGYRARRVSKSTFDCVTRGRRGVVAALQCLPLA